MKQEELKSFLEYCPDKGVFVWKSVRNTHRLGMIAGSMRNDGYWMIVLRGKHYFAHRLAFLYMIGAMPTGEVDHVNGNR